MDNFHTTVYYHAQCPDGAVAALVASMKLGFEGVRYQPSSYERPVVHDCTGQDVYILDFSFDPETLTTLIGQAKQLVLLDHHASAQKLLQGIECPCGKIHFDMSKSGARLAWDHFFEGEPVPKLVEHIEDRDLWTWTSEHTAECTAYVDSLGYEDFAALRPLLDFTEAQYAQAVDIGRSLVKAAQAQINSILLGAFPIRVCGQPTLAVDCPGIHASHVGNILVQRGVDFSVSFRVLGPDKVKCGLRSLEGYDTLPIATQFGGGGHPQASGFHISLAQFAQWMREGDMGTPI